MVLLTPQSTSPVGRHIEYLLAGDNAQIITYSEKAARDYYVNYLALDRGVTLYDDGSGTSWAVESGTHNKTSSGLDRVYFSSPFSQNPVVFLSPWLEGEQVTLTSIETLVNVTNEYFEALSNNGQHNYFVNFMALASTKVTVVNPSATGSPITITLPKARRPTRATPATLSEEKVEFCGRVR